MKTKTKVLYVIGIPLCLSLAFATIYARFLSQADLTWFIMLCGALLGAFGLEIWKMLQGRKISWDLYNTVDKVLFFYSLVTLLLFTAVPVRYQMPIWFFIGSLLAGYMLSWLPIYIFGSEFLKKNWFWQDRNSDM